MAHSGSEIIMKKYAISVISLFIFFSPLPVSAGDNDIFNEPQALIKVDSAGLQGSIMVTGKGNLPAIGGRSDGQAKLLARRAAIAGACKKLVLVVNDMPPEFFPKERYLFKNGYVQGARLVETRYYGDGCVEADVSLAIALEALFTEKFEKEMRLLGYQVVEYDTYGREITKKEWEELINK